MKPSRTRSFSTTTPMSEDAAVLVVNMDVEYTGPDGVTRTETFEHHQGRVIVPGRRVQIRVWPDERRAEFDDGDKHTGPIVVGSLLTLLGAGGTVLLFMWQRREAGREGGEMAGAVRRVLVVAVSLALTPLLFAGRHGAAAENLRTSRRAWLWRPGLFG